MIIEFISYSCFIIVVTFEMLILAGAITRLNEYLIKLLMNPRRWGNTTLIESWSKKRLTDRNKQESDD